MRTLETDVEIGADGSLKLLSPLPSWVKPGRVRRLLTLKPELEPDSDLTGAGGNIEKTQGVNGRDACVKGTRIPVWVLEEMRRQGSTEAAMLEDFPGLDLGKLKDVWEYAQKNRVEIETALNAHAGA